MSFLWAVGDGIRTWVHVSVTAGWSIRGSLSTLNGKSWLVTIIYIQWQCLVLSSLPPCLLPILASSLLNVSVWLKGGLNGCTWVRVVSVDIAQGC
jgi:hypothetical protein